MMKYLTRRKDPKKPDDYIYDGSKGTIRSEREITEEEINKDQNILRRIKYYTETYDGVKLGKDFDAAIAAEDKNLAALGRKPVNLYERGKTKPAEPSKVELPIPSFPLDYSLFNKPERNPEMIAAENNFKKMLAETEAKKNRLEGLEAIIAVKADDIKDF